MLAKAIAKMGSANAARIAFMSSPGNWLSERDYVETRRAQNGGESERDHFPAINDEGSVLVLEGFASPPQCFFRGVWFASKRVSFLEGIRLSSCAHWLA
jgi:hypothetical protein